jgi:hypothetical protein
VFLDAWLHAWSLCHACTMQVLLLLLLLLLPASS